MKRLPVFVIVAAAALTLAASDFADARRMGGGRSFGAQRESVTPSRPTAAQSAPASPTSTPAAAAAATKAPVTPPTPAPSGMSRWLGPIAGIAAGLGLAALLSHMGLSEGFGSLLLIAAALMIGFYVLRRFMSRAPAAATPAYSGRQPATTAAFDYKPSATPAWRPAPATATLPPVTDATAFGVERKALPVGFDAVGFAREAKRQYIEIQRLYDTADRSALAGVMTAEMAREVGSELDARGAHQPTEIIALDADVLDASTEDDKYWVSVRFTGQVREDGAPVPTSIDEVWNLTKPVSGRSGWLLAGISQLA